MGSVELTSLCFYLYYNMVIFGVEFYCDSPCCLAVVFEFYLPIFIYTDV